VLVGTVTANDAVFCLTLTDLRQPRTASHAVAKLINFERMPVVGSRFYKTIP
jgi:hypothetical protein